MDEQYWDRFRRRARRRASAQLALVLGPVILVVAAIKALGAHDYPAGDVRNEPAFWLILGLAALLVVGMLVIGSIRVLRER